MARKLGTENAKRKKSQQNVIILIKTEQKHNYLFHSA